MYFLDISSSSARIKSEVTQPYIAVYYLDLRIISLTISSVLMVIVNIKLP